MNPAREQLWLRFGRLVDTLRCVEAKAGEPQTDLAPVLAEFLADPDSALTMLERHLLAVTAAT